MGEEEAKKVEAPAPSETPTEAPAAPAPAPVEAPKDVAEEKAVIPAGEKVDDTKALAIVEKPLEAEKSSGGTADRDAALARVETEKRLSLIKAWEDSEKTKAENKAIKKFSSITSWENAKKAAVEADLRKKEEELEKKKAEYGELMKNKIAMLHKEAEEQRAMIEARKGEELLKAEEIAAKYKAKGLAPTKLFGCFGS
ncbi:remorin-like [Aristolochia californica]|uniref:remorin-like n=1 Tax=Aristolochia californica TaxID=171875 RepID=UPI0035DDDE61